MAGAERLAAPTGAIAAVRSGVKDGVSRGKKEGFTQIAENAELRGESRITAKGN
jgi:hypothetical protein